MKFEGKLLFIDETKDSSTKPGQTFFTRSACLTTSDEVNGTIYENQIPFQATGDKCNLLDGVVIGDKVELNLGIRGFTKKNEKVPVSSQNPEQLGGFVNLSLSDMKMIEKNTTTPDVSGDEPPKFTKF